MKIFVAKNLTSLVPVDDIGREALKRFKQGEIITVDLKKPRNPQFHRKFFAMLKIIFENQEYFSSLESLRHVCLIEIGECELIRMKGGKEYYKPHSMNFASMDELAFGLLYDKAVQWVITTVIPGLEAKGLDDMVSMELRNF